MEARESWMPCFLCQSLLLSTTVLNNKCVIYLELFSKIRSHFNFTQLCYDHL